ncbi:MAG: cysteine desulfurase-like protein [Ilumatobacteraceae bacterium]
MILPDIRHRFPGVRDGWARFDGPAGTQMVDVAIRAMTDWATNGSNANCGGSFSAAQECDALMSRTRNTVAQLFNADAAGVCLGANMTTMTMAFTRAVAKMLKPGDRVVGTRLDHDSNVSTWRIACEMAGAEHVLAPFDATTGILEPSAVINLINDRTAWVAVTGASNLLGTTPHLAPIIRAAHDAGARVFVDAVHLAVHQPIDVATLGCDVLACSPYKWYGPHAGVLCIEPNLLNDLPVAKVRPANNIGPARFETGTPNFEGIAAVDAAARFLIEEDMSRIGQIESDVFGPLLHGLIETQGVSVWGPKTMQGRAPTVAFTIDGHSPARVAQVLAANRIAVWAGHSYAVEAVDQLGLADSGGVVRAGVVRYVNDDDVTRLLDCVRTLASNR